MDDELPVFCEAERIEGISREASKMSQGTLVVTYPSFREVATAVNIAITSRIYIYFRFLRISSYSL